MGIGLINGSRGEPVNVAKYPNAITIPGKARGNIATESKISFPGNFFRASKYPITTPNPISMIVLDML